MLIHDRFIFIHVPKTGGMFLRDVLQQELPPGTVREGPETAVKKSGQGTHSGREEIPQALRGRPILAFVRNPWDWYVSTYHFMMKRSTAPIPDPTDARVMAAIFGDYEYDFAAMVRAACATSDLGFSDSEVSGMMEHGSSVVRFALQGHDLYTAFILGQLGADLDDPAVTIGRFESLVDDLERFFLEEEIVISNGAFSRMREAKPTNTTPHRPYREYYDDDLRDRVRDSCGLLLARFSYGF